MYTYKDRADQRVDLFWKKDRAGIEPTHVIVAAFDNSQWLMTIHPDRGLEWPGGKAEPGETIEQAAVREVYEETGVTAGNLKFIADYVVHADPPFCKRVFAADILSVNEDIQLRETKGAAYLLESEWEKSKEKLSRHMSDEGMDRIRKKVLADERQRNN
ncbi:8-oxo-dGTP diphosphatase [Bhargavaea ginsengi]|uniref:8-oxo-dGTP diphosphatase n=1 Tax=Bhargavaea ginsengi TaxID=426757 RepID=A0A1H6YD04_9BACL|nr:NUDIX domain-containing protein [Bhargavaea ginsengi]SEJ34625.1 8-oxo-dGTP diphosphatase [Bhargavaea ginsengi]